MATEQESRSAQARRPGLALLEGRGLTKAFPGVLAADAVDFTIGPGEIVGLIGENGAGKTTLVRMLAGLERPDTGDIFVRGKPTRFTSPSAARRHGIGMVLQHFSVVPTLTGLENLLVGDRQGTERGIIKARDARRRYQALQERTGLHVELDVPVAQLSVGERQRLEILKCMRDELDVIILDEPTAVINVSEIAALMELVRAWAAAGKGVVLISHKLEELLDVTQRIVVMRRGRVVAELATASVTSTELAAHMVEDEMPEKLVTELGSPGGRRTTPRPAPTDMPVLRLSGVTVPPETGVPNRRLQSVDLEVHAGRILGVAGIEGNGQRTLVDVILGIARPAQGSVEMRGQDVTSSSPRARLRDGLAVVHEDRKTISGVASLSVFDNLILRLLLLGGGSRYGLVRWRQARTDSQQLLEQYDVRATLQTAFSALSGGNQQRVVLARELGSEPFLLVAEQPTQGLDVHGAVYVRQRLVELRDRGCGIVLVSSELDEVLELADDIVVMQRGEITGRVPSAGTSKRTIARMMVGGAA
jgi:simple sugar transport system ATP-binding protein